MSDLEKTIEELEAEVLSELEEAEDPQKKGAAPAEKSSAVHGNTPGGEVQDTGKAVVDPEQKDAPAKKAAAKAKEVSGDAQQKGEGKPDKPEKLAAGDEIEHDGKELKENKKMTKAQHIENISKMKKADIEEMLASHRAKIEEADNAKTEEELKKLEDQKAEIDERIKSISVKEDMEVLMSSDDTLSEEFKVKAATIFEAAVKSKIRSEIERIDEQVRSERDSEMETFKEELTEKVDTYLNYVVEEWTKENELAIER